MREINDGYITINGQRVSITVEIVEASGEQTITISGIPLGIPTISDDLLSAMRNIASKLSLPRSSGSPYVQFGAQLTLVYQARYRRLRTRQNDEGWDSTRQEPW